MTKILKTPNIHGKLTPNKARITQVKSHYLHTYIKTISIKNPIFKNSYAFPFLDNKFQKSAYDALKILFNFISSSHKAKPLKVNALGNS